MGQDRLFNEKAGNILDRCVHVVATIQELCQITRKCVRLAGDYLGTKDPLSREIAAWPHHIDCFERQYDKTFAVHRLFRVEIVDRIHKRIQVFMHICNTTSLKDEETV